MINAVYVTIDQLAESDKHTFDGNGGASFVLEDFKLWERP